MRMCRRRRSTGSPCPCNPPAPLHRCIVAPVHRCMLCAAGSASRLQLGCIPFLYCGHRRHRSPPVHATSCPAGPAPPHCGCPRTDELGANQRMRFRWPTALQYSQYSTCVATTVALQLPISACLSAHARASRRRRGQARSRRSRAHRGTSAHTQRATDWQSCGRRRRALPTGYRIAVQCSAAVPHGVLTGGAALSHSCCE